MERKLGWHVVQQRVLNAISGTGVSGQVAFFNDVNSITGDATFTWDNTNKRLNLGDGPDGDRILITCSGDLNNITLLNTNTVGNSRARFVAEANNGAQGVVLEADKDGDSLGVGFGACGALWTFTNNHLLFGTNSVARAKILNTGEFNIFDKCAVGFTGTPTYSFHVKRQAGGGNEPAILIDTPAASDQVNLSFAQAGTIRWSWYLNNTSTPNFNLFNHNLVANALFVDRATSNLNLSAHALIGGTAATDGLTLQSTSGTGTTDFLSLKRGTNGGHEIGKLYVTSDVSVIDLNSHGASKELDLRFLDNGTAKWTLYKTTGNVFALYDHAATTDFFTATTAGDIAFASTARHRVISQNRFRYLNPLVSATKTTNQTGLTNSAWTTVTFDAEEFDTDTLHDNVTANTKLTANIAGKYLVAGTVDVDDTNIVGSQLVGIRFIANGGTTVLYGEMFVQPFTALPGAIITSSVIINLAATNYVEMQVFCAGTSGTYDVLKGGPTTRFQMAYIGE